MLVWLCRQDYATTAPKMVQGGLRQASFTLWLRMVFRLDATLET